MSRGNTRNGAGVRDGNLRREAWPGPCPLCPLALSVPQPVHHGPAMHAESARDLAMTTQAPRARALGQATLSALPTEAGCTRCCQRARGEAAWARHTLTHSGPSRRAGPLCALTLQPLSSLTGNKPPSPPTPNSFCHSGASGQLLL